MEFILTSLAPLSLSLSLCIHFLIVINFQPATTFTLSLPPSLTPPPLTFLTDKGVLISWGETLISEQLPNLKLQQRRYGTYFWIWLLVKKKNCLLGLRRACFLINQHIERSKLYLLCHSWRLGSFITVRVDSLPHMKWKKIKQQPSMLPGPAVPGWCWISLHFLWGKLSTPTVQFCLKRQEHLCSQNWWRQCQNWFCPSLKTYAGLPCAGMNPEAVSLAFADLVRGQLFFRPTKTSSWRWTL